MNVAAMVPASTMARPGRLMKLCGDSAVTNSTLISNTTLANMPMSVDGFIRAPGLSLIRVSASRARTLTLLAHYAAWNHLIWIDVSLLATKHENMVHQASFFRRQGAGLNAQIKGPRTFHHCAAPGA